MKHILLSADSSPSVYLVPSIVAENLRDFCFEFLDQIYSLDNERELEITDNIHTPDEQENSVCYDETGFIYWLNTRKFPNEPSIYVETLTWEAFNGQMPEIYKECPWFNF